MREKWFAAGGADILRHGAIVSLAAGRAGEMGEIHGVKKTEMKMMPEIAEELTADCR
jgi:hypothetical protein